MHFLLYSFNSDYIRLEKVSSVVKCNLWLRKITSALLSKRWNLKVPLVGNKCNLLLAHYNSLKYYYSVHIDFYTIPKRFIGVPENHGNRLEKGPRRDINPFGSGNRDNLLATGTASLLWCYRTEDPINYLYACSNITKCSFYWL